PGRVFQPRLLGEDRAGGGEPAERGARGGRTGQGQEAPTGQTGHGPILRFGMCGRVASRPVVVTPFRREARRGGLSRECHTGKRNDECPANDPPMTKGKTPRGFRARSCLPSSLVGHW